MIAETLDILDADLKIPYRTFGSEIALSIRQNWQKQVGLYKNVNPKYRVFPLHTVAGLITFHERRTSTHLEYVGEFENPNRVPWITYSVSGLKPLDTDSPLLNENVLPIFYPIARAARTGLETIEFGGGAVTANVTLNQGGVCTLQDTSLDNAKAPLQVTANYNLALKTSGTYKIKVNGDYLVRTLDSLRKSRRGSAHASAIAADFFSGSSSQTVYVELDQNLRNSFGGDPKSESAFQQTVLLDVANQFLQAATEGFERPPPRQIELPELEKTEEFRVLEKVRTVCQRKSYLFGLIRNKRCFDQVYDVKHLQNSSKFQQAVHRVRTTLEKKIETKSNEYVLVPAQASL